MATVIVQMLTGRLQPIGVEAAPAEGLTPYGFFMARPYGQPANQPVIMSFIAFKPSDGAKFRESFERKHGPRGRDLIDSLGKGSYKSTTEKNSQITVIRINYILVRSYSFSVARRNIKFPIGFPRVHTPSSYRMRRRVFSTFTTSQQ